MATAEFSKFAGILRATYRVLPREHTGHSKHPLPTTQEKTLATGSSVLPKSTALWVFQAQRLGLGRKGAEFNLFLAVGPTRQLGAWSFPGGASGKESTCQCRRRGFNPWVGKIPWKRPGPRTPVEETGDAGSIPGWGSGTHSSALAGRIPWTEEPERLQSMGSQRL